MEHLTSQQIKAKVLLQKEMIPGGRAEPSKSACCYQLPHSFSVGRDLQLDRQPAKAESSTPPGADTTLQLWGCWYPRDSSQWPLVPPNSPITHRFYLLCVCVCVKAHVCLSLCARVYVWGCLCARRSEVDATCLSPSFPTVCIGPIIFQSILELYRVSLDGHLAQRSPILRVGVFSPQLTDLRQPSQRCPDIFLLGDSRC